MSNERIEICVQKCMDSFVAFSKALKIRTKSGKIEQLKLNEAQLYIHNKLEEQRKKTGKVRAIILKGRQQGASTLIEARFLWRTMFSNGKRCFIITHEAAATKNLFNMAKLYIEKLPPFLKSEIGTDSANELVFTRRNASYKVGTAGNKGVGRSETIQLLHGSEVGFWQHADEHAKGILQAVSDEDDTEIIIESTANGSSGWFYNQTQAALRGEGEYQLIFIPWFWQTEYRKDVDNDFTLTQKEKHIKDLHELDDQQMMFRRSKISELGANGKDGALAFNQEYPCTVLEAFSKTDDRNLIPEHLVHTAMKSTLKKGYGRISIGVDPARFGDDRAAILVRQGRYIIRIITYANIDLMTLCGVVVRLIKQYKPVCVNIDKGGMGVGVYDRLLELGFEQVNGVDFGGKASQSDRYFNKRAEMWALIKLWLDETPCMLPNRDDLLSDLAGIRYSFDSNGRLKLESKDDMKKRGLRSPDIADALALTFAVDYNNDIQADVEAYRPADRIIGI